MIGSKFIEHNNVLYQIIRVVSKDSLKDINLKDLKLIQDLYHCDHTLQTNTEYMFCRTIEDAEILDN